MLSAKSVKVKRNFEAAVEGYLPLQVGLLIVILFSLHFISVAIYNSLLSKS
jgi:hypothetical protein